MKKGTLRRVINRFLHFLVRILPGATGFRPLLHRLRGVKVGADVFVAQAPGKAVAKALVPLTRAEKVEDFVRGLLPIQRPSGAS